MPKSPVIASSSPPTVPASALGLLGLRDFTVVPTQGHGVIKRGISSQVIEPVSLYLCLDKRALAEMMGLGRGTVTKLLAKGQNLPTHAAATLLRLLEIHDMAADVFVTDDGASAWLRAPHTLLDNERPFDAAKTSYGAQSVKSLLMSTKYGGAGL